MSTLWLEFEKDDPTLLRVRRQDAPWRVLRGFPLDTGETLAHLNNVSGGILDTDTLEWRVDVRAGAQAQITSTGATRIYRSRTAQNTARILGEISVEENGFLEYVPDALIPFAGSRFEQRTRIELGPGASVIWWELVAPGREASGERFGYESLASSFEIACSGSPAVTERWELVPALRPVDSPARLGPYGHFASCYVGRAGEDQQFWRNMETALQPLVESLSQADGVSWGISPLRAHGLAVRGVASGSRSLQNGLTAIWQTAKLALCGRAATIPRKTY